MHNKSKDEIYQIHLDLHQCLSVRGHELMTQEEQFFLFSTQSDCRDQGIVCYEKCVVVLGLIL